MLVDELNCLDANTRKFLKTWFQTTCFAENILQLISTWNCNKNLKGIDYFHASYK